MVMKTITATEAQNNFGDLLMNAQSEPISITRNGKEKGVLLSSKEYQDIKHRALQQAITQGIESGEASILNMADIKTKARQKMELDAKNR
jgi:antitoxin Phd